MPVDYLTEHFDRATTTNTAVVLDVRRDAEPQVATRSAKTFTGTCQKCGDHGHKARECAWIEFTPDQSQLEEETYQDYYKLRNSAENAEIGLGKMGETPRGRVDSKVAAALGLGTATTDHQTTDGINLATLASGPVGCETVNVFVKPLPTLLPVEPTILPLWTPLCAPEQHRKGHGEVKDDDEGR